MTKNDSKISPIQLFSITLFSMMFGLNLYPSMIGHDLTHEWFVAQIISVLLIIPLLLMILSIFNKTDYISFSEAIIKLIGNIPSRILGVFLFIYFLLHSLQIILLEANDIQLFLFNKTPITVIAVVFAITAFIISFSGTTSLARLSELLIFPVGILVVIILSMFIASSDFGEIKTLFQIEKKGVLPQVAKNISCFSCIEITFFFLCQTRNSQKRRSAVIAGYLFCSATLLLLTICITGIFTLNAGASLTFPVTEMARTIQLKFLRVIERFDVIILSVRIFSVCVFTALSCNCSEQALSIIINPKKLRLSLPVYLTLAVLILIGRKESFLNIISVLLQYSEMFILLGIVPALFIASKLRIRRGKSCDLSV